MAKCMFSTKFSNWEKWARATSCCAEFNADVAREMKEHSWSRAGDCDVEVCAVHEPLPHPSLDWNLDDDLPMTERAEDSAPVYGLDVDRVSGFDHIIRPGLIDCDTPIPSIE